MSSFSVDTARLTDTGTQMQALYPAMEHINDDLRVVQSALRRNSPLAGIVARIPIAKINGHIRDCQRLQNALTAVIEQYRNTESELIRNTSESSGKKKAPADPSTMTYEEYLEYRRKNAVDENTRRVYEKFRDKVNIKDDDYNETAHYQPFFNHIKYNDEEDSVNPRGPGNTYYHEVGHLVDDQSDWNGNTSTDGSYDFYDCLQNDIDNWIDRTMKEQGLSRDEAYEYLSDWLWTDPDKKNGISDIVTGLTGGEASGRWTHESDYYNKKSISKEAFAHFFEAGMAADSTKLDYIKEVFPSAYEEYQRMLEDELNS